MPVTPHLLRTLKFRMAVVVILLVLTATVVVTSVALVLAERDMRGVIGDQQYALLSATAAQIDSQLEGKRLLLAALAESMPRGADFDPRRLKEFAEQHPAARRQFPNLVLYDRFGDMRYSFDGGAVTSQQSPESREFFAQTLLRKRSVLSQPFHSSVSGKSVVLISQPLLDAKGDVEMVLSGSIDLRNSSFLREFGQNRPGKTGFMFIMTSKGILIHHPDPSRILEHINVRPGLNQATEKALGGFEGWTDAANKDGNEGIYAYKHLNSADWIVAARYPVDEAFAPMIAMRRDAAFAAAPLAVVAGLLAWLAILRLTAPLARLRNHIANIRSGKADIGVLLRRRRDEIGELSTAFHELMAEREAAQERIAASERRTRAIADVLPAVVAYLDRDLRYLYVNEHARDLIGVEPASILGKTAHEVFGRRLMSVLEPHFLACLRGERVRYERDATDSRRRVHMLVDMIPDITPAGSVVGVYLMAQDITRMKEIEERLIQLARVDTLTGIANRLMFEELLQLALSRSRRNRVPMALAYLDIDNFKTINDNFGHGVGDAVLKAFAARLVGAVRATDTVARLAGDEFVIVFEQVHSPEETARMAAKIVDSMREPLDLPGAPLQVTTSIGLALHTDDTETAEKLLSRADRALYAAKNNGRNGYALAA